MITLPYFNLIVYSIITDINTSYALSMANILNRGEAITDKIFHYKINY